MKPILPWAQEDVRRALDVQSGGPVGLAGPALALEEVLPLQPLPVCVMHHLLPQLYPGWSGQPYF